jgi:hypothetical protein
VALSLVTAFLAFVAYDSWVTLSRVSSPAELGAARRRIREHEKEIESILSRAKGIREGTIRPEWLEHFSLEGAQTEASVMKIKLEGEETRLQFAREDLDWAETATPRKFGIVLVVIPFLIGSVSAWKSRESYGSRLAHGVADQNGIDQA